MAKEAIEEIAGIIKSDAAGSVHLMENDRKRIAKLITEAGYHKLPILECLRCGHTWRPRTDKLPAVCPNPKCKSPYWNKPRKGAAK